MFAIGTLTEIITTLITIFCNTVVQYFIIAATDIGHWVTKAVGDTLVSGKNPLKAMSDMFRLSWDGKTLDLYNIIMALAFGVAIACFLLEVIRMLVSTSNGGKEENPLSLVLRTLFCFVAMVLLYGGLGGASIKTGNGGILNAFFKILFAPIGVIYELCDKIDFGFADLSINTSMDLTSVAGVLIVSGGILAGVLAGAMSIVERFVTIAIQVMCGPIFIAFGVNKEASKNSVDWFKSLLVQSLSLTLSMAIWYMALVKLNDYFVLLRGGDPFNDILGAIGNVITGEYLEKSIPTGAIAIVLFSLVGSIEEIFKAVGFKVTSSRDASRMLAGGFMGSTRALANAANITSGLIKGGVATAKGASAVATKVGEFAKKVKGDVTAGQLGAVQEQNSGMLAELSKTKAKAENATTETYSVGKHNGSTTSKGSESTMVGLTSDGDGELTNRQVLNFADGVNSSIETGTASIPKADSLISSTDGAAAAAMGVMTSAKASGGLTESERVSMAEKAAKISDAKGTVPINGTLAKMEDGTVIPVAGNFDPKTNSAYFSSLNPENKDLSKVTAVADANGHWVDVNGVQGLGNEIRGDDIDKYRFGDNQFAKVNLSAPICSEDVAKSYTNTIDTKSPGGGPPRLSGNGNGGVNNGDPLPPSGNGSSPPVPIPKGGSAPLESATAPQPNYGGGNNVSDPGFPKNTSAQIVNDDAGEPRFPVNTGSGAKEGNPTVIVQNDGGRPSEYAGSVTEPNPSGSYDGRNDGGRYNGAPSYDGSTTKITVQDDDIEPVNRSSQFDNSGNNPSPTGHGYDNEYYGREGKADVGGSSPSVSGTTVHVYGDDSQVTTHVADDSGGSANSTYIKNPFEDSAPGNSDGAYVGRNGYEGGNNYNDSGSNAHGGSQTTIVVQEDDIHPSNTATGRTAPSHVSTATTAEGAYSSQGRQNPFEVYDDDSAGVDYTHPNADDYYDDASKEKRAPSNDNSEAFDPKKYYANRGWGSPSPHVDDASGTSEQVREAGEATIKVPHSAAGDFQYDEVGRGNNGSNETAVQHQISHPRRNAEIDRRTPPAANRRSNGNNRRNKRWGKR